MPIYEYVCPKCKVTIERFRLLSERSVLLECASCFVPMERIYSVPSLAIWNAERQFLNAVKSGDGRFPTKAAYESHLKANNMAEVATDGKIYRPHGNRVLRRSV